MAGKPLLSTRQTRLYLAQIATERAFCSFCKKDVDDELLYGKIYVIGDIYCHYFCALLSCCLIQKGKDEEGLFGFLYSDILAEVERSKKHKCSYCMKEGATLGCSISQCRKQFHLPCGRERNAVSMFYGDFKSFCQQHVPKQKLPKIILDNIKDRKLKMKSKSNVTNELSEDTQEMVCAICYEGVDAFPTIHTFWPPCCARDAWFHRTCLQRMALSAGIHYLKCPLCNDKQIFYKAMLDQGYYVPDRDASWELEQNAFAEIYERTITCNVPECKCPNGREHDSDNGPWDIKLCLLCGIVGAHALCGDNIGNLYVCPVCLPAAPSDPQYLEAVNAMTLPEPNQTSRVQHRPRMTSRMSIRRTKPRLRNFATSSKTIEAECGEVHSENTIKSRQELNLKTPTRPNTGHCIGNESPMKLLKEELCKLNKDVINEWDSELIELVQDKLKKPKPLSIRRKIISSLIGSILNEKLKPKHEEPIKERDSPEKECEVDVNVKSFEESSVAPELNDCKDNVIGFFQNTRDSENKQSVKENGVRTNECENNILTEEFLDKNLPIVNKSKPIVLNNDSSMEISENNEIVDINVTREREKQKIALKFSPTKECLDQNLNIDMEIFKNYYLNEVGGDKYYESGVSPKLECISKESKDHNSKKDRKHRHVERRYKNIDNHKNIHNNKKPKAKDKTGVVIKFGSEHKGKNNKKSKTELSIGNKNIKVNIKWKKEKFNIKISNAKRKRHSSNYVFVNSINEIKLAPGNVSPIKRKYQKTKNITDHLKQTSLDSFFIIKSPEK